MGQSHSVHYNDMIQVYNPFQWRQLEDNKTFEVWQNIQSGKKHSVYPINITEADSEQNIQIYHFRKLNYIHLISAQALLKNGNHVQFCSEPRGLKILIEYIPVRLSQVNKKLGFLQRLSILYTIFAGLHTINYLYGPLYITQHMVGFTQNGKPKIWINEDFSKNEPSRTAKGEMTENSGIEQLQLLQNQMLVAEEMLNCVTQVFKTAGNSDVETYPYDFRVQAANVRTFSQGEELILNYCRNKSIELMENIPYWDYLKDTESEYSVTQNRTWIGSLQHSNPPSNHHILVQSLGFKQLPTQGPKRQSQPYQQINLQKSTTRWNPQPNLLTSSNTKITINYIGDSLKKSEHQKVVTSMTIPPPSLPPLRFNLNYQPLPYRAKENIIHVVREQENKPIQPLMAVRDQQKQGLQKYVFVSQPFIQPVYQQQIQQNYVTQPLRNPPLITRVDQELKFAQKQPQVQFKKVKNELDYKLQEILEYKIETNPQNEEEVDNRQITPQQYSQDYNSSNFTAYNTIDQIKLWQASLISKLSNKKTPDQQKVNDHPHYEHQEYQSCQSREDSQKVRFGGADSQSLEKMRDMQAYIRNKYRDYLTNGNENGLDSSQSDSNGGHQKIYSFGLKTNKMGRGRQNSLTGLKHNVSKRRSSIGQNVINIDMSRLFEKDSIFEFMSKAKKLGIDSQSKIIYQESARQSCRQSEASSKAYVSTFAKVKNKESQYSFHKSSSEKEQGNKFPAKNSQNSSYGKLEDRYNKYVVNKERRGADNRQSVISIQNQMNELSQTKSKVRDMYYIDSVNQSRTNSEYSQREKNNIKNVTQTPNHSRTSKQQIIGNYLTYDSLRDFLRK